MWHLFNSSIVDEAGISTGASDDEPGPKQLRSQLHLVVVYQTCFRLRGGEVKNFKKGERNLILTFMTLILYFLTFCLIAFAMQKNRK